MESASHKLLEAAVYRTLHAHSFSRSSSQASLVLTDLFTRYLSLLSTTCAKYAQHAGRTSMSVRDAIGALDDLGVSVDELSEYCSSEGKELSRYAIHSARRVEDLNEFRAQLADGLRQDRDDAIPLYYAPYNPSSEEEDEEEDEGEEDEQLEEQRVGDDVIQIVSTKLLAPPMPPPPSITPFGHYPVPPRISTPPLPPSPISNPSSPSARKRPRKGSWQPPDHIPDFLPPFPTTDPVASQSPDGTPQPMQTQFEPLPLPATENLKIERSLLNLSQPVTSSAASDYLLQVPYSQSSLSGVAEWHLPSTQPPPPQQPHQRNPALPTPQTEHSLVAAYHHILTHPPPANGSAPTPARHKVAMALLSQTQNIPRWDPPDTLYASVAPCTPRLAVIGPSYPMAIDGGSDTKGKVDGKDKEIKFPPTLPRPVAFSERLTPLVSQQLSRIPDLARVVLPPSIYSRTSRLTHPPPLQRGSKLLVYGNGIPAPWNANALPAPEVPPPTPGGAKLKDKEKDTSEPAAKPVLPDARLYATWDYEPKDFRIPLAPTIRSRARMGSTQSGVVSLSRPKPHKTSLCLRVYHIEPSESETTDNHSAMMDIIEISSSPEPTLPPFNPAANKSKRAGKLKAVSGPVFELSDSDSDEALFLPRLTGQKTRNAVAGPSSSRQGIRSQLRPTLNASSLSENIPIQPSKGATSKTPLFLPSDEENHHPKIPHSPDFEAIQPLPQAALSLDALEEDVQIVLPPEPLEPDPDPESTTVARVLEIIPDVEPDHVLALTRQHSQEHTADTLLEHILHILFENPSYPKVDRKAKGKRKQTSADADGDKEIGFTDADGKATPLKKTKIDYATKSRPFKGGAHYADLALEQLQVDFPYIPKPYLRTTLANHNLFYAPTYISLKQLIHDHEENGTRLPYAPKAASKFKGKKRELHDQEFDAELAWVVSQISTQGASQNEADEAEENGIECGCCFTTYPFKKMVQCPETHLFCSECMTAYASTLLGSHNPNIKCMDQSGCKAEIPASELQRFLPQKLMDLWERVKQRKEVESAGLEGLEECPFCEWSCVIENPDEKLFRCENTETCGEVSCRSCKKPDHLPKSCKEVEDDKHLDGQHAVEEAMTRALMRSCPKCKKPFIKEAGCNKMTCPTCGTSSCYVCRQAVRGYDHFDQGLLGPSSGKCPISDSVEQRHADEVKRAAEVALEDYKRDHPDIDEKAIKVDMPVALPPPQANGYHAPAMNFAYVQAQAALNLAVNNAQQLQAEEDVHHDRMLAREAELQLLNPKHRTMPRFVQAQEIARLDDIIVRARDEWYRARQRTEYARQAERQARLNLAAVQPQQAAAYNLIFAQAPGAVPPLPAARRPVARNRRR